VEGPAGQNLQRLAEGGMVKMKLVEQGFLTDRFGINWVFTVERRSATRHGMASN
jgi:uncharacterized glyoxalase superfamily protein PhnB